MSYQKVIIQGNLGNDPDIKYGNNGNAIAKISVATSTKLTDKNTGQKQEKTQWHNIVAFGNLAEIMGKYLKKGASVLIDGEIEYSKYNDKDGVEKWSTAIKAGQMQMLDSRGDNQGGQQQAQGYQQPQQIQPVQQVPQQQTGGAASGNGDFHPDVPF